MNKKGQAQIISTVLIILLVLAAVVIVWTIVEGFTKGAASIVEDSDICFKINLEILEANAESGAIVNDGSLVIKRGVGAGDLKKIAVVITDSEGREDRAGAGAVALGVSGIDSIRRTASQSGKQQEETISDMIANAASLLIGQRGKNTPAVVLRGLNIGRNTESRLQDYLRK